MGKQLLYIFALVLFVVFLKDVQGKSHGHRSKNHNSDGKIVGGTNTTIDKYPYQVYVLLQRGNQNLQCGGSIISTRFVLTAAHCLTGVQSANIRAGSTEANNGGTQYPSRYLLAHPRYNAANSDYDVGVIKTKKPMQLDGINARAVTLADAGTMVAPDTELTITGWGTTSEGGQISQNLMVATVPVVSTEQCRESYGQNAITDRMLCAGLPDGGKDSCQGDSGGPAVDNDGVQLGIVSFGYGCARPNYPGVYTNVSSVRPFIRRVTGV